MANASEVGKLEKEIEFLTNLINDAKRRNNQRVFHGRPPSFSQRASSSTKWINPSQAVNRKLTIDSKGKTPIVDQGDQISIKSVTKKGAMSCPVKNDELNETTREEVSKGSVPTRTVLPPGTSLKSKDSLIVSNRTVMMPNAYSFSKEILKTESEQPKKSNNLTLNRLQLGGNKVLFRHGMMQKREILSSNLKFDSEMDHRVSKICDKQELHKQTLTSVKSKRVQKKISGSSVTIDEANTPTVDKANTPPKMNAGDVAKIPHLSLTSPTLIEAGKKIIEEIEKLNKAVARIEKATGEGSAKNQVPLQRLELTPSLKLHHDKTNPHISIAQTVLNQSPPTRDVFKKTRYSLVKKNTKEMTKLSYLPFTSKSTSSSPSKSSFKQINPTQSPPIKLQSQGLRLSNKTSKFKFVPHGVASSSIRRVVKPSGTPRGRVYVTRNKLRNSPAHPSKFKFVKKHSASQGLINTPGLSPIRKERESSTQIQNKIEPKQKQSAVVRELLQELSYIDVALKTAKLQSSQKLVRKAVITKQKMMQRKSHEIKCPSSATNLTKWKTLSRCRSRSLSGSGHVGPSKNIRSPRAKLTDDSWKSRFSLKKTNTESNNISINQLLGRRIHNMSSNKYKFVSASSASKKASSPRKSIGQSQFKKDTVSKTRNTKSSIGQRSGAVVRIGGILYKSSRSKLRRTSISLSGLNKTSTPTAMKKINRTLLVRGTKFRVTQNGHALKRIRKLSADPTKGRKNVYLGGANYARTRPGTLVKNNHAATWITASRSISRSIATAVSAARMKKVNKKKQYCMFYNRFGKCNRGDKCPYIHDQDKVAVCTRYLRATCKVTDCPFSHKVAPEKMPVCTHYLKGVCSRDSCPYLHVNVSKDADICGNFIRGYCPLGEKCKKKHTRICPNHDGKGCCLKGKSCKLQHPRAGEKRPGSNASTKLAQVEPRSKRPRTRADVERGEADAEDDLSLPLSERHLPSFISLESDESASEESIHQRRRSQSSMERRILMGSCRRLKIIQCSDFRIQALRCSGYLRYPPLLQEL